VSHEAWRYWLREERGKLPEASKPPRERRRASDGAHYALRSRILELDSLDQRVTLEMQAEMWRDGTLEAVEDHVLKINLYFKNEPVLMLVQARLRWVPAIPFTPEAFVRRHTE
jgi:hypothetical protein